MFCSLNGKGFFVFCFFKTIYKLVNYRPPLIIFKSTMASLAFAWCSLVVAGGRWWSLKFVGIRRYSLVFVGERQHSVVSSDHVTSRLLYTGNWSDRLKRLYQLKISTSWNASADALPLIVAFPLDALSNCSQSSTNGFFGSFTLRKWSMTHMSLSRCLYAF